MDASPVELVRSLGGIASRQQLLGQARPSAISRAIASGELVRLRRSWFGLPGLPFDRRVAVQLGGRLGAVSAARTHGLWAGEDDHIHVSRPQHGNVAVTGRRIVGEDQRIVTHWRMIRDETPRRELWREPILESIGQVARWWDTPNAVATIDSALHLGAVTRVQLESLFAALPALLLHVLLLADGRSDSGIESIVRVRLALAGIDATVHAVLAGLEVDLLIGRSLVVEVDGRTFHTGTAFGDDRVRDNLLATHGYVVVRLSYDQVMHHWDECLRRIRVHLEHGDHLRPTY